MPRKLTYEFCKSIAKQFTRKVDFRKSDLSAYTVSVKNGWINDWFEREIKPSNYWTYERCKECASQFKYFTQFRDSKYLHVYLKSKKNGWINDWDWLINDLSEYDEKAKIHLIYIYIFKETNHFYVGRTMQLYKRDYSHRKKIRKRNGKICLDSVQKHSKENNIDIPRPIVLEENLTLSESKRQEHYWVEKYKKEGMICLNKAKTGEKYSSVGGGRRKWTYEKVYEEAKKYTHRGDFCNGSPQAYRVSLKYKWIDDYEWMTPKTKPSNYWTFEKCKEEALKYETKIDFEKNSISAYVISVKKGYMKFFNWFIRPEPHNKYNFSIDYVFSEMEKYKTKKEFHCNDPVIYRYALKYYRKMYDKYWENKINGV